MSTFDRRFTLACSLICLAVGLALALAHPIFPALVTILFCSAFAVTTWRPSIGLFALPALLPVLNLSPWSGWLIIDEFDLLILSVLAAGYLHMSRYRFGIPDRTTFFVLLAVAVCFVARGLIGISERDLTGFADFSMPLNGFRVSKSLLWTALLYPLIQGGDPGVLKNRLPGFFLACALSSGAVVLAVIWERTFYPGLLDFSTPYRTVALFWEMHLGGAALDIYLVLMAPILVRVWRATRSLASRLAFGSFALLFVYACLTTYSRGVVASIIGSLTLLLVVLAHLRVKGWQPARGFSLIGGLVLVLIVFEVALVAGADTYLNERLAASNRDLGGRIEHWRRGIQVLDTPKKWLFGVGLGKLPWHLTRGDTQLPLPGGFYPQEISGHQGMVLNGPDVFAGLLPDEGFYFLSQRVDLADGQAYRFSADAVSDRRAELLVKVCALHLLYPARCRDRIIGLHSGRQHRESSPLRPLFEAGDWRATGHGVLLLSVLTPGAKVGLSQVHLTDGPNNVVRNAQFLDGAAAWFPIARFYFLPWHIDNLYLEILIETGLSGLLGFLAVITMVIYRCIQACYRGNTQAPYFLSCIGGLLSLGAVVSVFDMPRTATLLGLILLNAWQSCKQGLTKPKSRTIDEQRER